MTRFDEHWRQFIPVELVTHDSVSLGIELGVAAAFREIGQQYGNSGYELRAIQHERNAMKIRDEMRNAA